MIFWSIFHWFWRPRCLQNPVKILKKSILACVKKSLIFWLIFDRFFDDLRIQNPPNWAPKSIKLGSKIHKNQSWEGSWGVLGGSWAPRGPKSPSKWLPGKLGKMGLRGFGRDLGPKIDQNPILNRSKKQTFCWYMLRSIFLRFWHQLGPQNPPKMQPSWDQVASEIVLQFSNNSLIDFFFNLFIVFWSILGLPT